MRRVWNGVWIYLLTIFLLILLGLFFTFKHFHPENSLDNLTKLRSKFTIARDSPCANAIVGEPSILEGDDYIKLNIYCPDSSSSTNVLRFNSLPQNPTVGDILLIISAVNNFDIKYTPDHQTIAALGKIESSNQKKWLVKINQILEGEVLKTAVHPKDWIEIRYE